MTEKKSQNIMLKTFSLLLFVVVFIWFYWLIGQDKTELPSQLIDSPAPNFKVPDLLDDEVIHTEKEFIGKITLVNIWASWCPSCYVEHPFWKEYSSNKDIVLVGLNYRDKKQKALEFIREQGNYYDWTLFDESGRLGIEFGVYGAPETFLIDRNGKIRYRHVGVVDRKVYKEIFLPLVEKIKQGF